MKRTILIVGDTCPIGCNEPLFRKGDTRALLGDLLPEFETADVRIANLECPLIETESPIEKCGPNLGSPVDCAVGLKAMGVDVVGLANNHVMDHGPEGLCSTIRALEAQGIDHVGAGENLAEARKILVRQVNGVRVGILALAEHEFCIAGKDQPGANPLDIIDAVRNIEQHRCDWDQLIVLLHGGNEHYPYPRPGLMDTCRFLIERGAGAVICQHSHCAGCMETYRDAPIIYGQGNFIFDLPSKMFTWREGLLIRLDTTEGSGFKAHLIPCCQFDSQPGARRMTAGEERAFLGDFTNRSEAIVDESVVERQWEAFCKYGKRGYLHHLHGKPGFARRLAGKLNLLHHFDSREVQRRRLSLIRCESHREALITVLDRASRGIHNDMGEGRE